MTSLLHEGRLEAVLAALRRAGARRVLDLGCGGGALLLRLAREPGVRSVVGVDPSREALERLRTRLAALTGEERARVRLLRGSLTEHGGLKGYDAAALVETIEHIAPERLTLVERAVFGEMRPSTVLITTPNSDFNALLGVPAHRLRHRDHRFEWGRAKFRAWAEGVAGRNGYDARFEDLGGAHPAYGGASQMAVLSRRASGDGTTQAVSAPLYSPR